MNLTPLAKLLAKEGQATGHVRGRIATNPTEYALSLEDVAVESLVPEPLLPFVAVGLPLIEVLAGLGLLFDIRGSLTTISGLLAMFVFVLWYGILKDLDVDCGCFGPEDLAGQGAGQAGSAGRRRRGRGRGICHALYLGALAR